MGSCAGGWHVLRVVAIAAVVGTGAAGLVAGQRIEVRAANDNGPLPGAMVVVEDPAGNAVTRLLADAAGLGRAGLPAGRYRVRVLAIGHAPSVSGLVRVEPGTVTVVRYTSSTRSSASMSIFYCANPIRSSLRSALSW
jgi:hypothetical protein